MSQAVYPKFQTAITLSHTILATTYHFFVFEVEKPLQFQPGQYLSVKVAEDRLNCYSIAGHEGQNKFSLLVDVLPGGLGSKFFENLKVGEEISYLGPFGKFILRTDDGAKHLLFLATGCGVAPLKCQIEAALKEEGLKLPLTLYLSFRTSQDVIFQDYFQNLAKQYPNFTVKIAVDQADENWRGDRGYITEILKNDFSHFGEFAAYLSGSEAMIKSATAILLERGCPRTRIYTEEL